MEKTFLNRCDDHGDLVAVDPFDIISDDNHLECRFRLMSDSDSDLKPDGIPI